jgi:hypothetical protein
VDEQGLGRPYRIKLEQRVGFEFLCRDDYMRPGESTSQRLTALLVSRKPLDIRWRPYPAGGAQNHNLLTC